MPNIKGLTVYKGLPKEVYILFLAKVITCAGSFILTLWTLILTKKIGISTQNAGFLTALLTAVQVISLMFGGKFIDKIGRKKVLCTCQFAGAAIYIICGIMPTSYLTAALIMVTAALNTTSIPALDALLADYTNPENRKQSYSLIYLGANLGYSFGPFLSGILFNSYLPLIFFIDAATTIISVFLIVFHVKEPSTVYKIKEETHEERGNFAAIKELFKRKELLTFILIIAFFQFCITEMSFMLPLQLTDIFKEEGPSYYGVIIMITAMVVVIFTPFVTSLTRGLRSLGVVALGGCLYATAYFIFGFTRSYPIFVLAGIIMTFGEILVIVNDNTFLAQRTPAQFRGRIFSIFQLTQKVFEGCSPVIMGSVIVFAGYPISWSIIGCTMLSASVCMYFLNKKVKKIDSEN